MNRNRDSREKPQVAVFGAAGHTGRFIVTELLCRGMTPIAIARDLTALTTANFPQGAVLLREASTNQTESLDHAIQGAQAVINCAGPFLETADAVAAAALRAGMHYLDISAEQASTRTILDRYDRLAREAHVAVIPAMGFYGGFADLLVTAALGDWDHANTIDIMIGLDSWHPTRGTRITGQKNTAPRMVVAAGQLVPLPLPHAEKDWDFSAPFGRQGMLELPFSEVILIARHRKVRELHTWINNIALKDIRDPATPAPKPADATGRSSQRFVVDVVVTRDGETRRITAHGQDIYAFSAPLVCEVATRLLDGSCSNLGAHPPGAVLNAQHVLSALTPDYLTFERTAD